MTADDSESFYDRMGIAGLLRMARKAYGNAVRDAFAESGFDDVPRNGAYVLARVYGDSSCFAALIRELGISKQATSQLIDTMVMRGYLERTPDSEDRRRMLLTLTPRGQEAATVSWQAASAPDEKLERRGPPARVGALRAGLTALCEMSEDPPPAQEPGGHPQSHPHPHPHDH